MTKSAERVAAAGSTPNQSDKEGDDVGESQTPASTVEEVIRRKEEGIDVVLKENVSARNNTTLLECVHLVHNALPEIDMDEIDLSCNFLDKRLGAPIIVDSMTGGAPKAEEINGVLAEVVEHLSLAMGLGSQRAGLLSAGMARTYSIARKRAPTAFLFANIGGPQLARGFSIGDAKKLIEMIDADALAVHLNPLQEVIQPEGEPSFRGVLRRIRDLCDQLPVPIIVKEVGAGISGEVAAKLARAGVSAINVSGAGGTSWAGVEALRAGSRKMDSKAGLGELFWDWGIPTAAAVVGVKRALDQRARNRDDDDDDDDDANMKNKGEDRMSTRGAPQVIASGGLRNGLEVAKSISLGADVCGFARPMLEQAARGTTALSRYAEQTLTELKATMFITGSRDIAALRRARRVITPPLTYWL